MWPQFWHYMLALCTVVNRINGIHACAVIISANLGSIYPVMTICPVMMR